MAHVTTATPPSPTNDLTALDVPIGRVCREGGARPTGTRGAGCGECGAGWHEPRRPRHERSADGRSYGSRHAAPFLDQPGPRATRGCVLVARDAHPWWQTAPNPIRDSRRL